MELVRSFSQKCLLLSAKLRRRMLRRHSCFLQNVHEPLVQKALVSVKVRSQHQVGYFGSRTEVFWFIVAKVYLHHMTKNVWFRSITPRCDWHSPLLSMKLRSAMHGGAAENMLESPLRAAFDPSKSNTLTTASMSPAPNHSYQICLV